MNQSLQDLDLSDHSTKIADVYPWKGTAGDKARALFDLCAEERRGFEVWYPPGNELIASPKSQHELEERIIVTMFPFFFMGYVCFVEG